MSKSITVKKMPTLFKLSIKGKLLEWNAELDKGGKGSYVLFLNSGAHEGKMRTRAEAITEGKNAGKANETSVLEQAIKEMQARFDKQLKKGYVLSKKDALKGKVDKIIKGGITPMLAEKYQDHKKKIKFPVFVQPKLNGMRCIAIQDEKGGWTLWSRTRKQITSCPHIEKELKKAFGLKKSKPLDGELYVHGKDFEKLMSAARKKEPSKESEKIIFNIFDIVDTEKSFKLRFSDNGFPSKLHQLKKIKTVTAKLVRSEEELKRFFSIYIGQDYEGMMVRAAKEVYQNRRSTALLKYKEMQDAEFKIEKFTSGEEDTVIVHFHVKGSKVLGKATMEGTKKDNQHLVDDSWMYYGKKVTVRFQEYSNKNGLPLFPVGVRVREEE